MTVEVLAPEPGVADAGELAARLAAAGPLRPFADAAVECCAELSRELFRAPEARAHGELQALAFWLRRSAVERLRTGFDALRGGGGAVLVPRGLAFHLPPTNVDTVAAYSLATSLLVGNANVVRLSERRSPVAEAIVAALRRVLAADAAAPVRERLAVISYGHDTATTGVFSDACDIRIIWGGDASVRAIRAVPLAPGAKELAFPDRFSFAALRTDAWHAADAAERDDVARRLCDDAFTFGQQACSSPRLVVWCGRDGAGAAGGDLFERMARAVAARGFVLDASAAVAKLGYAYGAAIDRPVIAVRRYGNELTVLTLETLDGFSREHPGAGLFFEVAVDALADLTGLVAHKDQTLVAHGFGSDELERFAVAANGRGVERIVPVGEALDFDRYWDGADLLAELTRRVVVRTERRPSSPR